MNIILADSIDGGIFIFLLLIVGGITSLIALIGLAAAWKGDRAATILMIFPAVVCWLAITIYFICLCAKYGLHDPHFDVRDQFFIWMMVSGAPLATSAITFCVFGFRRAKAKRAKKSI
jgi:hypothetical protein